MSLTVLPPDFTITASNASAKQGQGGTSTIAVGALYGFTGAVGLSVTSVLPTGVTATFNPASIDNSGTSTLTLTPNGTLAGSYPMTVTGVSGALSHSANFTLTVSLGGVISLTANPATVSVSRASQPSVTTTIAITSSSGFNGNVTLTASGLPKGSTASFSPSTVSVSPGNPGTTTMTISVTPNARTGNSNVTVTGNSGGGGPQGQTKVTLQALQVNN